ncbi:hypothetical protein [Alkalihalobacillus sp. BA299]|uniref:hypothetical protein n=1 Tax=Alkalihalobacillus sp. BA299 TaxID=2815938 RepID=UPI001FFE164F|nr:hypothetical protein [Alkalihalobacillus sp. BA299]
MPHKKHRGQPLDLALSENEVSQEFAEELADGGERNIAVEKQKNRNINKSLKKANGGTKRTD